MTIATTHVGSLPRSQELAKMLIAKDHGEDVSPEAFDRLVTDEIAQAVRDQLDAGVTIVSDGELGKVQADGRRGQCGEVGRDHLADRPGLARRGRSEFVSG